MSVLKLLSLTFSRRFIAVFFITICVTIAVNLVPYLRTHGAHQYDGQEIAGFPFIFHKVGGDCFPSLCDTYNFHAGYFFANSAIGLACALVMGLFVAALRKDWKS